MVLHALGYYTPSPPPLPWARDPSFPWEPQLPPKGVQYIGGGLRATGGRYGGNGSSRSTGVYGVSCGPATGCPLPSPLRSVSVPPGPRSPLGRSPAHPLQGYSPRGRLGEGGFPEDPGTGLRGGGGYLPGKAPLPTPPPVPASTSGAPPRPSCSRASGWYIPYGVPACGSGEGLRRDRMGPEEGGGNTSMYNPDT